MNRMECKTLCKLNKIKLGKSINGKWKAKTIKEMKTDLEQ